MDQKLTEQQQAQNLYFQTELSQTQIATLLGINRKTLYTWIKDGCWERAKYAAKHVPCILAEQYLAQLGEMNNMIAQRTERPYPTKEEADIMRKVAMTHKNVKQNRKSTSDNIELFVNFTQELRRDDYKIAQQFMPYMDKYIQTLLKEGHGLNNPWKTYLKESAEDREYEEWLSAQPKSAPLTAASFPPGYFTYDYQAQEVVAHPELLDEILPALSDAPPSSPLEVVVTPHSTSPSPLERACPDPSSGAGVRPTPAGQPNSQTENNPNLPAGRQGSQTENNPNSQPPIPNSQTENGVSNGVTTLPKNTLNPLPVNTSAENDNMDLSTKENEKWGEATPAELSAELLVTVSPVELPVIVSPIELPIKADRWTKFLEENYQISEDPYVTRKNGITIIRRGSPLWGRNSSLFFK